MTNLIQDHTNAVAKAVRDNTLFDTAETRNQVADAIDAAIGVLTRSQMDEAIRQGRK